MDRDHYKPVKHSFCSADKHFERVTGKLMMVIRNAQKLNDGLL
jgi:hypothetical protein